MFFEIFLPFITAVLALLIIPGPDMALVVANGAAYGKRGAFFSSLGISSGGLVLALITAVIIATAVSIDSKVLTIIQLIGCLYLLYIAIRTIHPRAASDIDQIKPEPYHTQSRGNLFFSGVVTNLSNPKALIFFTAFIPQFIPETSANPSIFAFVLGSLLCLAGFGVNFTIGVTGTLLSSLNKIAFAGRTWSQWVIFIVFFAISLTFLISLIIM